MKPLSADKIAWACRMACRLEVKAEKPGNVTRRHAFNDVNFKDFIQSADAIGIAFVKSSGEPVGKTILRAVQKTRQQVNSNTNLGIILLLAPLAKAAEIGHPDGIRAAVGQVLDGLNINDAVQAYAAIRLAVPGGLGRVDSHDITEENIDVTLLESMHLAMHRDTIAREYATGFETVFTIGYPELARYWSWRCNLYDAIVQCFLTILSRIPDTLIMRKNSRAVAEKVSRRAGRVLRAGGIFSEQGRRELKKFDITLRDPAHRLNPGTTADLVAASLFVLLTEIMIQKTRTNFGLRLNTQIKKAI